MRKVKRKKAIEAFDTALEAFSMLSTSVEMTNSEQFKQLGEAKRDLSIARANKMSAMSDGDTRMKITLVLPEEEADGLRKMLAKPNGEGFEEVNHFSTLWAFD